MQIEIDLKKCKKLNVGLDIKYADNFKSFQAKEEMFENYKEYIDYLTRFVKIYLLPFKISNMQIICVDASIMKEVVYIGDLDDNVFCHDFLIENSNIENNVLSFDTDNIDLYYEKI